RLYRFGYACASFGRPISLAEWQLDHGLEIAAIDREARFGAVQLLADDLMKAVGAIVPALPVALAAHIFLQRGEEWIGELELKSAVFALMSRLEGEGAHVHIPRADRDYAVSAGLRMLILRHMVDESEL